MNHARGVFEPTLKRSRNLGGDRAVAKLAIRRTCSPSSLPVGLAYSIMSMS